MKTQLNIPLWAQKRIQKLEKDVAHWKAKALQAAGAAPSNTQLCVGMESVNLPEDSTVRFIVHGEPEGHIDACAAVLDDAPHVLIRSVRTMVIRPWASNTVYITIDRE